MERARLGTMYNAVFKSVGPYTAAGLLVLSFAIPVAAADLPMIADASSPVAFTATPPARWTPATSGQFWAEVDYLSWTVKGDRLPALVTTSPAGTPRAQAGVLSSPGTTILFGDSAGNDGWRSGGRLQAGYWFDRQQNSGVEASAFGLENLSSGFSASSSGNPILARPFFNTSSNQQDGLLVAFPGSNAGSMTVRDLSHLLGASALYRQNILSWGGGADDRSAGVAIDSLFGAWGSGHIGVLVGYRYRYVSDRLDIASTIVSGPVSISVSDVFNTTNNFHGLDLGLSGDVKKGPWSLEWRGKVALGANLNDTQVNGSTASTTGGVTTVMPAGLLASSNNIGNNSQTRFAVMPEFSMKLGYQLTSQWRIVAGCEVMYWPGVQRAGDVANAAAGASPPPSGGPPPDSPRPQAPRNESSLLAEGFSIGLKLAF
ncbi:hypothetical protein V1282_001953 [Nitrobacteraceae bacterium AZCC 2146]